MQEHPVIARINHWVGLANTVPEIGAKLGGAEGAADFVLATAWQGDASVRAEFGTREAFTAYGRGCVAGRLRII